MVFNPPHVSPKDFKKFGRILLPDASKRISEFMDGKSSVLLHYTSAENAFNIIRGREIWIRKSSMMNDISEINHGLALILSAVDGDAEFRSAINNIDESLFERVLTELENHGVDPEDTYISCFSEHSFSQKSGDGKVDELKRGRLSMWRAYAQRDGVALVFSKEFLFINDEVPALLIMPVFYWERHQVIDYIKRLTISINENLDKLKGVPIEDLVSLVAGALQLKAICIKDPGFSEEREWRLIHRSFDNFTWMERLTQEIKVISGIPQSIRKIEIPIGDPYDWERTKEFWFANVFVEILVGPSNFAEATRRSLAYLLDGVGVQDPDSRVRSCGIPLRV